MIKPDEKKYKINVIANGNTLTYTQCIVIKEDDTWVEFSDKFGNIIKYNKSAITSMEELR